MAEVGDKYIIEIGEIYETTAELVSEVGEKTCETPDNLYRVKGFRFLAFDENGLDKLERYDADTRYLDEKDAWETAENKAYQKGLDDAWECARKIANMDFENREAVLDTKIPNNTIKDILMNFSAFEAIAKIKAYEEQKKAEEEEIKVGDEVTDLTSKTKAIVTNIFDNKISVVWYDGSIGAWYASDFKKTGRTFPQIAEVLKQLQEGE